MSSFLNYFNKPLLKIPLIFGAATGVMAFLFFLGLYLIGVMPLGNKRTLDIGIYLIMMISACWYYRKKVGHGYMHFWEGLTIGYVVNSVGAFVSGWLVYLFIAWIDPGLFVRYLAEMKQLLMQGKPELVKRIGEVEFQAMLKSVSQTKPGELITDELSKKTVLAVLPILIISLLFRRQAPETAHP
ncbi:DUF4199 domain-containing protein [Salmonirosea aquatica]|uniref:DUF4199 family protein n=1 Tax=Salmonirosea aquatica TaxID=2654236 RepID=A0A7C9BIJ7_9BACT|nr:DUF4199 family protein [Cytophagaceae bacterium SJW1-29]